MGSCLAVEVREDYLQGSGLPVRHSVVREKDKMLSDESAIYRPRSSSVRHDDVRRTNKFIPFEDTRQEENESYRAPVRFEQSSQKPFEPLPPPLPPAPMIHNNARWNSDPHGMEVLDTGGHRPNNHNGIQIIGDSLDLSPRAPRSHKPNRRMVVHSSGKQGRTRKYYDDSDDDSWVESRPKIRYPDDAQVEVYRPGRRRTGRQRSRSRSRSRKNKYTR